MKLLKKTAFGETRIALTDENDRLIRLFVTRENALNLNETVTGTVTNKNTTLRGYFVMTEKGIPVFVPSTEKKAEGETVFVQITKEARLGKDANGQFVPEKKNYKFIQQVIDETGILKLDDWNTDLDEAFEEALNPHISFANGALLHIERTNTCWTIDIDSGTSTLPLPQVNEKAVPMIAEQIILKNLSGIILIDFAGFKLKTEQHDLHNALKKLLAGDKRTSLYGFSKTHLYEMKRRRTSAALADVFLTPTGRWNTAATSYRIQTELAHRKNPKIVLAHPTVLPLLKNKIPPHIQLKPNFNNETDLFEIIGE